MKFVARMSAVCAAAVLGLAGCASAEKQEAELLTTTLESYASVMRWGDIEQALAFIDPAVPVDAITVERLKQVQIAGYRDRGSEMTGPLEARNAVQLELVNRHTQEVRSIVDEQRWRYDPVAKKWWLMSGLPDITPPSR